MEARIRAPLDPSVPYCRDVQSLNVGSLIEARMRASLRLVYIEASLSMPCDLDLKIRLNLLQSRYKVIISLIQTTEKQSRFLTES